MSDLADRRKLLETPRDILNTVFANVDPFDEPLQASQKARAILFPVECEMEGEELRAVATAALAVGDRGFYVAFPDVVEWSENDRFWLVSTDELDDYSKIPDRVGLAVMIDHAIYSPSGRWGMLRSAEQHAVLGGIPPFMHEVLKNYPAAPPLAKRGELLPSAVKPKDQVRSFLAWYAGNNRLHRVERIVKHVEGSRADALLAEFRLKGE